MDIKEINIREIVLAKLATIVEEHSELPFPINVTNTTKLNEFWLDSIAFAALMSELEMVIGYIPEDFFMRTSFPETVGDLVQMYINNSEAQ